ncbi:MAG TPA: DUF998 domain-containing protein [Bacteroidota bacterium]|nr:DUF998 domain-containing protein [Bacteroidota bacterium]
MSTLRERNLILSYLSLRRMIGVMGISLPIILVLGGLVQENPIVESSISAYYYTNMRDFYVGLLSGVALFLISYKGYEKIDEIVCKLSGICIIGLLLFPTSFNGTTPMKVGILQVNNSVSESIHLTFGAGFFVLLAYNSIFLFTKKGPGGGIISREKKRRNLVYRICGCVMILSIIAIFIYQTFYADTELSKYYPVLICESVALLAFGISWLVKGDTLFRDQKSR